MSGEADLTTHVVVWEDGKVVCSYRWWDWLKIPLSERPWDNTMVRAKDELDAMLRAERGEEWYKQGADK